MGELIFKQHQSKLDQSVNFEHRFEDHPGMLEARYVRRVDEYFIVYLSSQTGCKQACRMCWLTATGQTKLRDTTIEEYLEQAREVLEYYWKQVQEGEPQADLVHFNFMARGEPLANKIFLDNADEILERLADMAMEYRLNVKFLISTIFPEEMDDRKLTEIFRVIRPEIYYSIYSIDPNFRRRWLPKAMCPDTALSNLNMWQEVTGKIPKIHYAFIKGENDTLLDVAKVADAIQRSKLNINWNIVRYNPPNDKSEEPTEFIINNLYEYIRYRFPKAKVKLIPRVGIDVMASCGTFLK